MSRKSCVKFFLVWRERKKERRRKKRGERMEETSRGVKGEWMWEEERADN